MRSFFWDFYDPNRKKVFLPHEILFFCFIFDCENIIIYIFCVVSFCSRLNRIFWFLSRCQFIIFNLGKFFHKKFIASFINGKVEKLFFCFLLWMFVFSFFFSEEGELKLGFCVRNREERGGILRIFEICVCIFGGLCWIVGRLQSFKN